MVKIMVDGFFKAQHLKMKNPWDDVPLADGHGFMVTAKQYNEHIKIAQESVQVCSTF